ncbi:MAG: MFS transporter [candidate division NC10 bacterium]|nr:MFS transporter [candidate division NC10 bacterium]
MDAQADASTSKRHIFKLSLFFAAIYFVQGITEPNAGIASQPIFFLLKDGLHLTAAGTSTFLAIVAVAWNIKPLYGLTSDFFPLFGYRRKSYLLLTTALAAAAWFLLGSQPAYSYGPTLLMLALCGLGLAFSDVLCDAVMVETGKPLGMTGRFQAVQWGAINTASVLAGIGGGWLSQNVSYQRTFLLVSAFPLVSLVATAFCVHEARTRYDREVVRQTARAVGSAIGSRPLWVAAAFIFLWNFSPSFGVPLEYHLVDTLGFSKIFLGTLDSLSSAAAIVGAAVFGKLCQRLPMRRLLNLSVGIGVATAFAYWGLVGRWSAVALTIGNGAISMIAALATYDLAARSCPDKAEGTFFAALMSIANIGTAWSQFLGGRLYDWLGMKLLILVSGLTTAVCWLIVPLIRIDDTGSPPTSEAP